MDFPTNKSIIIPSCYLKSNSHSGFLPLPSTFFLNSVSESITPHWFATRVSCAKPEGCWLDMNAWGWAGGLSLEDLLWCIRMWPRLDQANSFTVEFNTGRTTKMSGSYLVCQHHSNAWLCPLVPALQIPTEALTPWRLCLIHFPEMVFLSMLAATCLLATKEPD